MAAAGEGKKAVLSKVSMSNRKRDSGQRDDREDDDMGGNQRDVFGKAGQYLY
jgi:hypothetical protein